MSAPPLLVVALISVLGQVPASQPKNDPPSYSAAAKLDGDYVRNLQAEELLSLASSKFEDGKKLSYDARKAQSRFREAARIYDELWRRGLSDPNLALNRAHSHRLAGDLPAAILALREGLAFARWSRPLQVSLEDARSAVGYPVHSDLESICRPRATASVGTRMSPREAQILALVLWLPVCGGITRFVMTRVGWWLWFAAFWLGLLAVLGALWLHDYRSRQGENSLPIVVLGQDAHLRKGNAETFPLRLDGPSRLPRGVEAEALALRSGWVQIRLASGIMGWVPERAVLKAGDRD